MTKEDLKQCNAKWKELHQIETLLTEIQADARSTRAVCYDSEPKHKGEPIPAVQTYVERLEELSNWYEQLKGSMMKDIRQVEQEISKLPPDLRVLMRYRYVQGKKWEWINGKMYISESKSKRMHKRALKLLEVGLV